jgi:hypothetical protein
MMLSMTRSARLGVVLSAALALAMIPRRGFAWSDNGHKTVGYIAQYLLTQAAQNQDQTSQTTLKNIQAILGPSFSLAEIAPCADRIRQQPLSEEKKPALPSVRFDTVYQSQMQVVVHQRLQLAGVRLAELLDIALGQPQSSAPASARRAKAPDSTMVSCGGLDLQNNPASEPWHFIDIPISVTPTVTSLQTYCPGNACVVDQIEGDVATLRDQTIALTDSRKMYALMYLVHFVGDEHQPLHCSTDIENGVDDRGGNGKPVTLLDANGQPVVAPTPYGPLELHALWDDQIEATDDGNNPVSLSAQLETGAQMDPQTASWSAGGDAEAAQRTQLIATTAALESFNKAKQTIYPAYYANLCRQFPSNCPAGMKGGKPGPKKKSRALRQLQNVVGQ